MGQRRATWPMASVIRFLGKMLFCRNTAFRPASCHGGKGKCWRNRWKRVDRMNTRYMNVPSRGRRTCWVTLLSCSQVIIPQNNCRDSDSLDILYEMSLQNLAIYLKSFRYLSCLAFLARQRTLEENRSAILQC